MKPTILEGKGVCKTFVNGSNSTNVLRNMDVEIIKGDFTVVMGASGSGKSTLLYCLSGIDKVTTGQILLGGKRIDAMKEKDMAGIRRKDIGFIFQESNLIDDFNVFENVAMSGYLVSRDRDSINKRTEKLLKDMDMLEHMKKYPAELSGGQKQRTAIARSLINSPTIVFADEPTGALNAKQSELVLDLLSDINEKGQSILMVTHDIKAAARANRLMFISDGKIDGILDMEQFQVGSQKEREQQVFEFISSRGW